MIKYKICCEDCQSQIGKRLKILKDFQNEDQNKWYSTYSRNLSDDVFGDNVLFKKLQIFDPFEKVILFQHFDYYKNLFLEIFDEKDLNIIENEFKTYFSEEVPDNQEIDALTNWINSFHKFPKLSKIAISFLCMACGSYDAERSFSKMRDINTVKRNRINSNTLKTQMIMYFNGDIEQRLVNY